MNQLTADHVTVVAGGVAFFGLLAVFPAIAALISIAGLVTDPADVSAQLASVASVLPEGAATILEDQATKVASSSGSDIGLAAAVGLLLALYSASTGVNKLIEGVNIAYEEDETRGFVTRTATALGLTLFLVIATLLALTFTIVAPALVAGLGLDGIVGGLITYLRWPVLAALAIFALAVVYRFGPDRANAKWSWITPGAVLATVLWIAGSIAFSIYVTNFASYNETYGTIGGVIILLLWLYLSAYSVLLGAEFNSEMEHQTRRDTTTGEPKELGNRGATMADHVAGRDAAAPEDRQQTRDGSRAA